MVGAQWKSKHMYTHPAKHHHGMVVGKLEQSNAGVYVMTVGGCHMSVPQDWAARLHYGEMKNDKKNIVSEL